MEYVKEGENSKSFQKNFVELMRIAAHSEQTFLFTQALLHVLSLKVEYFFKFLFRILALQL